jgi:hypothetical protein
MGTIIMKRLLICIPRQFSYDYQITTDRIAGQLTGVDRCSINTSRHPHRCEDNNNLVVKVGLINFKSFNGINLRNITDIIMNHFQHH